MLSQGSLLGLSSLKMMLHAILQTSVLDTYYLSAPEVSMLMLQATSVGQAIAGFAVSVLSFVTTWAALVPEPGEERGATDVANTAFAYFALSAAVIVASGAGYWMLQFLPFWLHHTSSHSGRSKPQQDHQLFVCKLLFIPSCNQERPEQ